MKVRKEGRYIKIEREGKEGRYDLGSKKMEIPKEVIKGVTIKDILCSIEDEVYGRYLLSIDILLNKKTREVAPVIGEKSYEEELMEWLTSGKRKKGVSISKYFNELGEHEVLERYYKIGYKIDLESYTKEVLEKRGALKDKFTKEIIEGVKIILKENEEGELRERLQEELQEVISVERWEKELVDLMTRGSLVFESIPEKGKMKIVTELKRLKERKEYIGMYILLEGLVMRCISYTGILEELNWDIKRSIEGARYYVDIEDIGLTEVYIIWRDTLRMMRLLRIKESKIPKYLKSKHNIVTVKYKKLEIKYNEQIYKEIYESVKEYYEYEGKGYKVKMLPTAESVKQEGLELKHCVASYIPQILKEAIVIVSLREEEEKAQLTMEIRRSDKAIVQIRGKNNRKATVKERGYIREYAEAKGLKVVS